LAANAGLGTMDASNTLRQTREYEHAAGPRDAHPDNAYRESYLPEHAERIEDPADFDFLNHMEDFHSFRDKFEESLAVGDRRTSDSLLQVWGVRSYAHFQQVCRAAERFAASQISFEAWVECEVALAANAPEMLATFGLTPKTWALATAWWSRYFEENAMDSRGRLHLRFSKLDMHYRTQYGI
jgi:hypothetical protein